MQIKKAGIILKKDSVEPKRIAKELVEWFQAKAIATVIDEITPDLDIIVVLGGDGTLLHVADQASRFEIPVLGVNLGGLGFLTEVAVADRYDALDKVMAGVLEIDARLMIKCRLHRKDDITDWQYSLNDVVISKGNVDRLVRLSTWADDEYITTYKADGLVFSTPTGATAYNLSAGGPIVRPGLRSILVTPICPFMLESRPVILPASVRLATKMAGPVNDGQIIVDGRSTWDMQEDDILEIKAAEKPLCLICSPQQGYFEILRSKLNWGGEAGFKPIAAPLKKLQDEK